MQYAFIHNSAQFGQITVLRLDGPNEGPAVTVFVESGSSQLGVVNNNFVFDGENGRKERDELFESLRTNAKQAEAVAVNILDSLVELGFLKKVDEAEAQE